MSEQLRIEGSDVIAMSPEGRTARMTLNELFARVAPRGMDTDGVILPAGVRAVVREGAFRIWVHETPPRVHSLKWIAEDSPSAFGRGTKYRQVSLALPYVIVLAVFAQDRAGRLQLQTCNECFFCVSPLQSEDDELCYPALLNCSKFEPQEGHPLSWICTQYLNLGRLAAEPDHNKRVRASFAALRHCLFETGFNRSSEHHETSSWFTESRQCDERVSAVEKWEAASARDKCFVLEVPWLKTGHTVKQVAMRIARNLGQRQPESHTAATLARILFNQPGPKATHGRQQELQELINALGI